MEKTDKIIGYKGFDKDWKCRGMQYEVGKEYTHEGNIELCKEGLHFCENPLDLFDYYSIPDSHFAEVEATGVDEKVEATGVDKKIDPDSKRVAKRLKIKAELGLGELIGLGIKLLFDKVKWTKDNSATGYQAGAQATGDRARAQATGDRAGAQATGDRAGAQATGDQAGAQATGYQAGVQATGDWAVATAVGDESSATISKGKELAEGCACSFGRSGKAKGDKGCWLTLAEWKNIDNQWHRIDVQTKKIDGDEIKENVFYQLVEGKFNEA